MFYLNRNHPDNFHKKNHLRRCINLLQRCRSMTLAKFEQISFTNGDIWAIFYYIWKVKHCVKSVQIRSNLRTRNYSVFGHFSRSESKYLSHSELWKKWQRYLWGWSKYLSYIWSLNKCLYHIREVWINVYTFEKIIITFAKFEKVSIVFANFEQMLITLPSINKFLWHLRTNYKFHF